MRNLKVVRTCHVPAMEELVGSQNISIDPDTGRVLLTTATTVVVLDPQSQEVMYSQSLLCDSLLGVGGEDHMVGVQYLPDRCGACLATSNGNLTMWNLDTDTLECVGSVDSGITAMQWSPDQELLALTTGEGKLLLMTREFDTMSEVPLHSSQFGEGEFMSVGWGKKETQFHGSEGKQAARKQKEDAQGIVPWDDRQVRIRWRGDGDLFAVSAINPANGARYIRVWTRECVLQSTSEPMNGLEQALFWKPSGALIASTQQKPNKHDVIFFEKNGLQHGEFTLPAGQEDFKVLEVMWNLDSTILAVWCQQLPSDPTTKPSSSIQLWTSSNYHWSLKQTLTFDSPVLGDVSALTWDPEQAGQLHVVTSQGHYLRYTWTWVTNRSVGQTSSDPANVFVIDGSAVKVTPMRRMVVPPPMSAYQLPLPAAAAQVVSPAFPSEDTGNIGVLTHDNQFMVFSGSENVADGKMAATLDAAGGEGFTPQCTTPVLQASYRLVLPDDLTEFPLCISHLCWFRSDALVFSISGSSGPILCVVVLPPDPSQDKLQLRSQVSLEAEVLSVCDCPSVSSHCVAVQLVTGHVLRFLPDEETVLPWLTANGHEVCFPVPCTSMEVTTFNEEEAVLGLTDRFRFYVNGTELASNCTSFAVHEEFLLLTTLSHTVRCISRHTAIEDLPALSDGKSHPFDESVRQVERGSRIVTVVAEDTKLVLQMPRGNLETIHPRALVLGTVRRLLDELEFGSAFMVMKKHRISLNLLYDHNPAVFLEKISVFLEKISSVNDINVFLTELQEDDVTQTMYTAAYRPATSTLTPPAKVTSSSNAAQKGSKVDTVCDALKEIMQERDADKYRLAILTTLVKKSEPQLSEALQMVWKLRAPKEKTESVSAEQALKFLLFLVDVNKLYDAALATYNFDLVLMVAEKSQKDPKEYLPFLNTLRGYDEYYCRYTIDRHLNHYSCALHHIALCGPDHFTECVDLVQEHKLYVEALKLFPSDSLEFKTLAREYGHYLRSKNRHDEAGVVFTRAELWQMAFDSFVEALNWRQAMCIATQLNFNHTRMADVARSLAVQLRNSRKYTEAAVLFEQYAKDGEEAIVTLIQGAEWDEALRLIYLHNRADIIETHLKDAIKEACEDTMVTLGNQQKDMEGYVDRLAVVRQEKERRHLQIEAYEGANGAGHMNSDLFSETSSMTGDSVVSSQYSANSNRSTVFSKASGRSNRNRRKAEHKKWSLKEGSSHEDCALIDAIAKIITATDSLRDEVNALLHVLTQFHQVEPAEGLQRQYEGFLGAIQRIIPVVWVPEDSSSSNTVLGPGMTSNAIAQAMQQGCLTDKETDQVLQFPPTLKKDVRWKLHMLQTAEK